MVSRPIQGRSIRIDAMRGAAMICVVQGHAIQRNLGADEPLFWFLAAFEMPLFSFVSGYLTRPPSQHRFEWIATRVQRLLVPFVAWAPVMWFMSRFSFTGLDVVGIPPSLIEYLSLLFARPYDGLWYLLVLFYWCLIVLPASPLLCRDRWIPAMAGASVIGLIWLIVSRVGVPTAHFGRSYLLTLLPYFVAGFAFRYFRRNLDEAIPPVIAGVSLIMFSVVFASVLFPSVIAQVCDSRVLPLAKGALGVTASVLLIQSIPDVRWLRHLATVGRASLGVYVVHLLFLRSGFGEGWTKAMTSFALALALSLLVTWLARKHKLTSRLLLGELPVSSRR